jgi:hypothetical protein
VSWRTDEQGQVHQIPARGIRDGANNRSLGGRFRAETQSKLLGMRVTSTFN